MTAIAQQTLIEVRDLEVYFALHGTFWSRLTGRGGGFVKAVDGVSFDLREGEALDEAAFTTLILAAAALNTAKPAKRPKGTSAQSTRPSS